MSTTAYRADDWDRFNAMPAPAEVFVMTCAEGHASEWSHREWHILDSGCCPRVECPGSIDFAHARRHVDCPCDEALTEPLAENMTAPGTTPTAPAACVHSARCRSRGWDHGFYQYLCLTCDAVLDATEAEIDAEDEADADPIRRWLGI